MPINDRDIQTQPGLTAGAYTFSTLTVNAEGILTAAASGVFKDVSSGNSYSGVTEIDFAMPVTQAAGKVLVAPVYTGPFPPPNPVAGMIADDGQPSGVSVADRQFTYHSASSALTAADPFQAFDTTNGNLTVSIPDASTWVSGECGYIDIGPASSGHTLTFQCVSGQTVNGASTGTVGAQYMAFTLLRFYNTATSSWGWLLKG